MKLGFVGPSYSSQSVIADGQRCINWYPERMESENPKSPLVLYPTPGLSTFCTLAGPSVRVAFTIDGRCFAVSGTHFYEVFSDGTFISRGAVADDGQAASIAAGPTQLLIISGGVAYSYNLATNVLASVVGMLGTPSMAGFTDGYFLVLLANSNQFQISALLDTTSWDGADTAKISVFPGNLSTMLIDHREVWFFGGKAIQVYYDSGNPDFPFEPIQGAFIEQGIIAPWSFVRLDNSIFWLGGDERGAGIAWRAQGYTPARVSNHATEFAWQSYSTITDAIGYAYQDQGHGFWVLTFPTAKATWVYDSATGLWHERGYWHPTKGIYEAHLGQCHTYCFGKHLVGDRASGKIYEMNISLYDDAGDVIRRLRRGPHISNEQKWIYFHSLQVEAEAGLGLATGQGSDPQIMHRWSDDGGKTWSNERWASACKIGEYKRRSIWRRLGRARDRVPEIVVTDPIPWRIIEAYLEVS